ncbi:MAG TPA: hypothetical protein VLK61_22515 [Aquabacterium sp.]|nr:hypothetical protein [Aquabacterium sp.]
MPRCYGAKVMRGTAPAPVIAIDLQIDAASDTAWLGMGAVLESHRRHGGQGALMARCGFVSVASRLNFAAPRT